MCVLQHRADIRDTKLFLFSQQNGSIYHFFCGGIFFLSLTISGVFSFQFHHLQHTRRVFKNLMRLPSVDIATGDATLYLFSPFHLLVKNDSDKWWLRSDRNINASHNLFPLFFQIFNVHINFSYVQLLTLSNARFCFKLWCSTMSITLLLLLIHLFYVSSTFSKIDEHFFGHINVDWHFSMDNPLQQGK